MKKIADVFMKAVPIWLEKQAEADEFAEFLSDFSVTVIEKTELYICADSNYAAYLNGKLVSFSQYPGYPSARAYDTIDLTPEIRVGENELRIMVWYCGAGFQTYAVGDAGVIFEVRTGEKIQVFSGEETFSRLAPLYVSHLKEEISSQLGFTYHIDNTKDADTFRKSRRVSWETVYEPRPIERLVLRERTQAECILWGSYFFQGGARAADRMQQAALTSVSPATPFPLAEGTEFTGEGDGVYFIVDIGKETAGFLELDMEFPEDAEMMVGFGEHMKDGRLRTAVRNFALTFRVKKGKFTFTDVFRRLGCRYLQFFVNLHSVRVRYAGLRPTEYPLKQYPLRSGNLLRDTIWDVSVNTLIQCMHEHYEDCPLREQALYTLDSRNQMLCGYYAFKETRFPRASLKLISRSLREDHFLSICAPDHAKIVIPFFNFVYFLQMREYWEYSGDLTLLKETVGTLRTVMDNFIGRVGEDDLLENPFGERKGYWNFYEWSETMSGVFDDAVPHKDAVLNAAFVLALRDYAVILDALGEDGTEYIALSERVRKAIRKNFYRIGDGLFISSLGRFEGKYSVLTNAFCFLAGAHEDVDPTRILRIIAENGGEADIIPATISMNCFRYDALLLADKEKYSSMILNEIDRVYLEMLRKNATSFWEVEEGPDSFGGAASLCHGWSALPVYYYSILM